jgi:hypothetical protein
MKEMADFIINHYERHAREWDADRNSYVGSWNDKPWHDALLPPCQRKRPFSI